MFSLCQVHHSSTVTLWICLFFWLIGFKILKYVKLWFFNHCSVVFKTSLQIHIFKPIILTHHHRAFAFTKVLERPFPTLVLLLRWSLIFSVIVKMFLMLLLLLHLWDTKQSLNLQNEITCSARRECRKAEQKVLWRNKRTASVFYYVRRESVQVSGHC